MKREEVVRLLALQFKLVRVKSVRPDFTGVLRTVCVPEEGTSFLLISSGLDSPSSLFIVNPDNITSVERAGETTDSEVDPIYYSQNISRVLGCVMMATASIDTTNGVKTGTIIGVDSDPEIVVKIKTSKGERVAVRWKDICRIVATSIFAERQPGQSGGPPRSGPPGRDDDDDDGPGSAGALARLRRTPPGGTLRQALPLPMRGEHGEGED